MVAAVDLQSFTSFVVAVVAIAGLALSWCWTVGRISELEKRHESLSKKVYDNFDTLQEKILSQQNAIDGLKHNAWVKGRAEKIVQDVRDALQYNTAPKEILAEVIYQLNANK